MNRFFYRTFANLRTTKDFGLEQIAALRSSCIDTRQLAERVAQLKEVSILGDQKRVDQQHKKHKLTARERMQIFMDDDTFVEYDQLVTTRCTDFGMDKNQIPGDAVAVGHGKVNGRPVFAFAYDFTKVGGSLSRVLADQICKVMDTATKVGAPCVGINDSGGARIQEGVESLMGFGDIFYRNVSCSGVIPQISLIMGPCAGGAVYSPSITDFTMMVKDTSYMFITGPDVVKAELKEDVTAEELGGWRIHSRKSGVCHLAADNEIDCLMATRRLLEFLPQNNKERAPHKPTNDPKDRLVPALNQIVPEDPFLPYEMKFVINQVCDDFEFFEIMPEFAKNLIVGFGRINGETVGFVANQPLYNAGALDIPSSKKGARFIRTCDAFNIPLVTFIDVPGFLPGVKQESSGIIVEGAKMLYAYAEATVPKISFILRKAYGGAYIVMSSRTLRGDTNYAWPSGEVAVMGARGAVQILNRSTFKGAEPPADAPEVLDYEYKFQNPIQPAQFGQIEDIVVPAHTRKIIAQDLELLKNKKVPVPDRKHGNIPL